MAAQKLMTLRLTAYDVVLQNDSEIRPELTETDFSLSDDFELPVVESPLERDRHASKCARMRNESFALHVQLSSMHILHVSPVF